jgi:hypothetical protein
VVEESLTKAERGCTSADFARYIDAEVKKATDVATAANIRQ